MHDFRGFVHLPTPLIGAMSITLSCLWVMLPVQSSHSRSMHRPRAWTSSWGRYAYTLSYNHPRGIGINVFAIPSETRDRHPSSQLPQSSATTPLASLTLHELILVRNEIPVLSTFWYNPLLVLLMTALRKPGRLLISNRFWLIFWGKTQPLDAVHVNGNVLANLQSSYTACD